MVVSDLDNGLVTIRILIIILDKWQNQFRDYNMIITTATALHTRHVMLQARDLVPFVTKCGQEMPTLRGRSHLTDNVVHKSLTLK